MTPPGRSSLRTFLLLFLGTFALLTAGSWRYFFASPLYEDGDAAVNALKIDRAKDLREIHGNYSRYYFQHPGPAFFQVYALAERVFCDALPTGLPPYCVHSVAGLALQSAFFALALTLAASWIPGPVFPALALLAGALFFSRVPGAFTSIWPPYVLLMPFLAFWVACASVAAGRGEHLPWVFLSGSFLVHGHVAQPLFVVVLSACAYAGLAAGGWRTGSRPPAPWRTYRREHWWGAAIVAVFLLPIALDLLQGAGSNCAAILRHLRLHRHEHQRLGDSVLYFVSFFGFRRDQAALFAPGSAARLSFLREQGWLYAGWLLAMAAALGILASHWGRKLGGARRLLGTAFVLWAVTAGLCLVWGILQTGEMNDFNGHFYFSVIYGMLLVFCALLAALVPWPRPRLWAAGFCAAAAVIAVTRIRIPPLATENNTGLALRSATLAALRADPDPAAPKLLVFPHDDWPRVAAAALTLERAGATFYVGGGWAFMFGRSHQLPRELLADPRARLSVWRFVHSPAAGAGVPIAESLRLGFEPGTLSPDDGLIDCSRDGNLQMYTMYGLVTPDADAAWTEQPDVALQFRPLPASRDVELQIMATPFLPARRLREQPAELWLNGERIAGTTFTGPGVLRARIARDLWNRYPTALLVLHLPNARSPAQLRLADDPRLLGLEISRLTARPAPP